MYVVLTLSSGEDPLEGRDYWPISNLNRDLKLLAEVISGGLDVFIGSVSVSIRFH